MKQLRSAIFLFATDLHDEGIATVLDRVQQAGLDGVTLACAYHHARDIFPHNPVRKVRFLEGGTVFFQPDTARYAGLQIQPQVSSLAAEQDMLAALQAAATPRQLAVRAWTVFLHNTTLGSRHPDCTLQNVFGDPYITNLCPAHPEVRAFACALAADLASRGVETILAESLGYGGFDHGYHHERSFIALSPLARLLFGLCFCEHCQRAIAAAGVDGPKVRHYVRTTLEAILAGSADPLPDTPVEWADVAALADGELGRFLTARQQVVTSLAAAVQAAVAAAGASNFVVMDMAGAAKGYATGEPTGAAASASAWREGIDPAAIAQATAGLAMIGYARDPERLRFDLAAYRTLIPAEKQLTVALRPMRPDCTDAENLRAKIPILREQGVAWVDFYHYGFMRLDALDWIQAALASEQL